MLASTAPGDIERDHEGQTKRRVDHRGDGVADDIATRLHELQHARQLAEHLGRGDERCERVEGGRMERAAQRTDEQHRRHNGDREVAPKRAEDKRELTAAMKRSAPIMRRLMDVRSTMVPPKAPRSAMGKKAARLTNDRALAEPVVTGECQMRPICRMELVSTEKNSPIQTMASERFQEAQGFGCVME